MVAPSKKPTKMTPKSTQKAQASQKNGQMPVKQGKISYTYRKDAFNKVKLA